MSPVSDARDRTATPPGEALARAWRYAYRTPLLLWHLLVHLPLVMLALVPPWSDIDVGGGETFGHRVARAWSSGMLRVFGFRPRRFGTPLPGATLFVANHVSWIDIVALHSQRMMGLVAKHEIASWPVVGWVAGRGETIFHQRGSQASLDGVMQVMLARLRSGHSVGVFPEGRARDGIEVGPFHARTFLAAVEAGVPVQPVALRYGIDPAVQAVVAFGPDENFLQNFLRLLGEPARVADIVFCEGIAPGAADGRRGIAALARGRIVDALRRP